MHTDEVRIALYNVYAGPQKFSRKKSVDILEPMWYNGLASEGEGSSPTQVATEKVVDKLTTMWYTGDSREGNRTTPQKVLDNQSKVWYNLGKSNVRHSNHSLKSLLCTA